MAYLTTPNVSSVNLLSSTSCLLYLFRTSATLTLGIRGEVIEMADVKTLQLPLYEEESNDLIEQLNYNLQIIEERLRALEEAAGVNQNGG